jgi:hypothetical protein
MATPIAQAVPAPIMSIVSEPEFGGKLDELEFEPARAAAVL